MADRAALARVTVIIPAYNVAAWLETAVRSVMRQTEKNLEILIVDDGSTDDSHSVALWLATKDSRIRVMALAQNSGRAVAMNHAMRQACGQWIAVLDGDDWYAPERLQRLLDIAEAMGVDMIADDWIAIDGKAGLALESPLPRQDGYLTLDLDVFLTYSNPTARADLGMLKPIVRADFVRRNAIEYNPLARNGQDFYFLLSYFSAGGHGLLINEAYYYYVEPFGTISRLGSHAGRKRYRFEELYAVNDLALKNLWPILTAGQRAQLEARGMSWRALISFHQLAEAIAEGLYGQALVCLVHAPPTFWPLLADRLAQRLETRLFGLKRKVLGRIELGDILQSNDLRPASAERRRVSKRSA
ncbi:MAG: hypothetical protein JWM91_5038 [Rhodospirillales bacterium]|nr:hypothetical protein [Rhodospirillales bacterium]